MQFARFHSKVFNSTVLVRNPFETQWHWCIIIRFSLLIKCDRSEIFLLLFLVHCLLLYLLCVIRRATTQFSYTTDSLLFSIVATVFIQIAVTSFRLLADQTNGAKNHIYNKNKQSSSKQHGKKTHTQKETILHIKHGLIFFVAEFPLSNSRHHCTCTFKMEINGNLSVYCLKTVYVHPWHRLE